MDVEHRGSGTVTRCWNWVVEASGCFEQLMWRRGLDGSKYLPRLAGLVLDYLDREGNRLDESDNDSGSCSTSIFSFCDPNLPT
jgi:hypothetical protein